MTSVHKAYVSLIGQLYTDLDNATDFTNPIRPVSSPSKDLIMLSPY